MKRLDAAMVRAGFTGRVKCLGAILPALLVALVARPFPAVADDEITVFAAASLAESFREIGERFKSRERLTVRFNFAGSQQLVAQLDQGAQAAVFASADQRWMREVESRQKTDGPAREFAGNQLVVLVPKRNVAHLMSPRDLARPGVHLVIGAENVPVGAYTREAMRKLASQPGYPPDYLERVLANVVSHEDNVRGVVGKVQLGEADAGICYRSDISRAVARLTKVVEIPAAANVIASYPIAVLKGAPNPAAARRFVAFVLSPEGQKILLRHGFLPPGPRRGRHEPRS